MSTSSREGGTGKVLMVGVAVIAVFLAFSVAVIVAVTSEPEPAFSSRAARSSAGAPRAAEGGSSGWSAAAVQRFFGSTEPAPGPPPDVATLEQTATAAAAAHRTVRRSEPRRMEAVNWKREKPPRSAEDLE